MKKNVIWIVGIIVLILLFSLQQKKEAGETMQIGYTTINSFSSQLYQSFWRAQTFATSNAVTTSSIKLRLRRFGSPGYLKISIRNTESGLPIGIDLISAQIDGNSIPSNIPTIIEIPIIYSLQSSTKYALIVSHNVGNSSNNIAVYFDNPSATYSEGELLGSNNGGSIWFTYAPEYRDLYFEIWGISTCTPSCSGKTCGDDGCGGSCGTCSTGYTCTNNQCIQSSTCPSTICNDNVVTFDEYIAIGNEWVR